MQIISRLTQQTVYICKVVKIRLIVLYKVTAFPHILVRAHIINRCPHGCYKHVVPHSIVKCCIITTIDWKFPPVELHCKGRYTIGKQINLPSTILKKTCMPQGNHDSSAYLTGRQNKADMLCRRLV